MQKERGRKKGNNTSLFLLCHGGCHGFEICGESEMFIEKTRVS